MKDSANIQLPPVKGLCRQRRRRVNSLGRSTIGRGKLIAGNLSLSIDMLRNDFTSFGTKRPPVAGRPVNCAPSVKRAFFFHLICGVRCGIRIKFIPSGLTISRRPFGDTNRRPVHHRLQASSVLLLNTRTYDSAAAA